MFIKWGLNLSLSDHGENLRLYGAFETSIKDRYGNDIREIAELKRRISLAKGKDEVNLIIKNARIINVFSGVIYQTDVAIANGIFVGVEKGYDNAKRSYNDHVRYMCSGLIDGHIHIE